MAVGGGSNVWLVLLLLLTIVAATVVGCSVVSIVFAFDAPVAIVVVFGSVIAFVVVVITAVDELVMYGGRLVLMMREGDEEKMMKKCIEL